MNPLLYPIASGQAFFAGAVLIVVAAALASRVPAAVRSALALLGLVAVAISATPVPLGLDLVAAARSLARLAHDGRRARRWRVGLRAAVVLAWATLFGLEVPYHLMPTCPRVSLRSLDVVGDSIGAGLGDETVTTWPELLARRHKLDVRDHSRVGATAASALAQADRVGGPGGVVLVEIGGNDLLGSTTAEAFGRDLDALLARLRRGGRTVVMLELPLPPFASAFGAAQRRQARRHGVILVPKRLLLGVLTTPGATVDTVHLTPAGHDAMARRLWPILRTALGP
jgi:acyl-CoA thioesterase-1